MRYDLTAWRNGDESPLLSVTSEQLGNYKTVDALSLMPPSVVSDVSGKSRQTERPVEV